ncbi:MAG: efflux RND transporter permease subunit, partial [Nannocystaceae bacterium]
RWVLRRPVKQRPRPIIDRLSNTYARLIRLSLRFRRTTLVIALAVAGSAAFPATQANYNLGDVEEQPDDIPIGFEFFGSPSHRRIAQHLEVVENALLERKQALGLEHVSCSYSDWWAHCSVHPETPAQSEAEVEVLKKQVKDTLPVQTGVRYRVGEDRFRRHRSRDRNEVRIAVMGEDMGELMALSTRVAMHLRNNLTRGDAENPEAGGYDTITGPADEGSQELHIKLDPSRLRTLGLRSDAIAQTVSTAFQGLSLGQVHTPDGEIELRMSAGTVSRRKALDEGKAAELDTLRDLRINLPNGGGVTLGSLAKFETARSPFFIQRVDRETQITIKIRFFEADPKANKELVNTALESFTFPTGYRSGDPTPWRRQREAQNAMVINLGMCLLLVYAVMASLFESFLQPFAILATCLLGCLGAPWAMWFTGTTVDTTAMIGLFILIGIVVNNGIMLIDRVQQLRSAGVPRALALERAGRDRLRPILMTATTTVLGLLPMLIHHPTLAGVYYHSIAIIISGGLITSTVVTLVFLPAIYSVIEDISLAGIATFRRFSGG